MKSNMFIFFLHKKSKFYKSFALNCCLLILLCFLILNSFIYEVNSLNYQDISKLLVNNTLNLHFPDNWPFLVNFPNPFSTFTYIYVRLPQKDTCELKIFDYFGNIVTSYFLEGQQQYIIVWDGTNNNHSKVSTGGYICMLRYQDKVVIRKIGFINRQ